MNKKRFHDLIPTPPIYYNYHSPWVIIFYFQRGAGSMLGREGIFSHYCDELG